MLMPFGFSNSSVNTGIGRHAIGNEKGHLAGALFYAATLITPLLLRSRGGSAAFP